MNPLDKIREIRKGIERDKFIQRQTLSRSTAHGLRNDMSRLSRFIWQVGRSSRSVWSGAIEPTLKWLSKPARYLFWKYVSLWERVAYVEDDDKIRHFSRLRGGLMIVTTGAFLYWVVPAIVSSSWDLGWYLTTVHRDEQVILFDSQEIGGVAEDVHSVKGCQRVAIPCPDNDTVYYRIRPHLFHHMWAVLHHGDLFYPDFVAAAVPPGYSQCTITSYGIRMKFILRNFDMYPNILSISCRPVQ